MLSYQTFVKRLQGGAKRVVEVQVQFSQFAVFSRSGSLLSWNLERTNKAVIESAKKGEKSGYTIELIAKKFTVHHLIRTSQIVQLFIRTNRTGQIRTIVRTRSITITQHRSTRITERTINQDQIRTVSQRSQNHSSLSTLDSRNARRRQARMVSLVRIQLKSMSLVRHDPLTEKKFKQSHHECLRRLSKVRHVLKI